MDDVMGENQWFQPTVRNRLTQTIVLANFHISYGKFYNINRRFHETPSTQGTKIATKQEHQWGHCGRQSSPSGTEGTFEVRLDGTNEKIAEIYWSCPYKGDNKLTKPYVKWGYDISFDGFSLASGALGKGKINIRVDV